MIYRAKKSASSSVHWRRFFPVTWHISAHFSRLQSTPRPLSVLCSTCAHSVVESLINGTDKSLSKVVLRSTILKNRYSTAGGVVAVSEGEDSSGAADPSVLMSSSSVISESVSESRQRSADANALRSSQTASDSHRGGPRCDTERCKGTGARAPGQASTQRGRLSAIQCAAKARLGNSPVFAST